LRNTLKAKEEISKTYNHGKQDINICGS
jgi:hypothetical protein